MRLTTRRERGFPRWVSLAIVAGVILFLLPFYYFGRMDLARPSLFGAAAISLAIATLWKLRGHGWFWPAIAIVVALHIYAILRIDWDERYLPSFIVVTFGLIDYGVVLALIKIIDVICRSPEEAGSQKDGTHQ